jgi:hypothetical protein
MSNTEVVYAAVARFTQQSSYGWVTAYGLEKITGLPVGQIEPELGDLVRAGKIFKHGDGYATRSGE